MSKPKSTPATAFDTALAVFREAEGRLRALVQRRDELSSFAKSRDVLAAHEGQQRAVALARADFDAASEHDRVAQEAGRAAQEARDEIGILEPAITQAEAALFEKEDAADTLRAGMLHDFAKVEFDALVKDLRPRVLAIYQARVGAGNFNIPMRALMDELADVVDYRQFADEAPLPVQAARVRSGLISRERRRELQGA